MFWEKKWQLLRSNTTYVPCVQCDESQVFRFLHIYTSVNHDEYMNNIIRIQVLSSNFLWQNQWEEVKIAKLHDWTGIVLQVQNIHLQDKDAAPNG